MACGAISSNLITEQRFSVEMAGLAMATPLSGTKMVSSFKARPDYQLIVEPAGQRIRVEFNGEAVADSDGVLVLRETRLAPTYYFPRVDVRVDLLERTDHITYCPFKGNAAYWTLVVGDRSAENAVWSYEDPYSEAAGIAELISFYWDRMDAWYVDGERVFEHAGVTLGAAANPLVEWLLDEAWEATTSKELVRRFVHRLNQMGLSVLRLNVVIQTLHPLLAVNSYRWSRLNDEVERFDATYEIRASRRFVDSPLQSIFEGGGGVRRWIDTARPDDYPILRDLKTEGATEYVAMPLRFSDGQINAVTIATDAPEGFSTAALGQIHEVLPLLSRLFEVQAKERTAVTLMRTFLGKYTGDRVLNGLVKRGDGEDIHAVIWFCDLRGSTPLADSLSRVDYLEYLNRYFDCMAGAVVENSGEVLRFIGDAVLAIFPFEDGSSRGRESCGAPEQACELALNAARDAMVRVRDANAVVAEKGQPPIGFGIGLHIGDVTYGNIGIPERLEFTVIGAAANEAARIEGMSKELGNPVMISDAFARCYPGELVSLGRHGLRGLKEKREIFTLPET